MTNNMTPLRSTRDDNDADETMSLMTYEQRTKALADIAVLAGKKRRAEVATDAEPDDPRARLLYRKMKRDGKL